MDKLIKSRNFWIQLLVDEEGATMVEYGLKIAFIAAVVAVVVSALGSTMGNKFTSVIGSFSGSN